MDGPDIKNYSDIVGKGVMDELYLLSEKLKGKVVQNINSTSVGGGVAEILTRMIPMLKQLGVDARWDVIKGNEKFFSVTKKIHNAMHGVANEISDEEMSYFLDVNRMNAGEINFTGDIIFIHDPQPIALIEKKKELGRHWIWRCHIDLLEAIQRVMDFIKSFAECYDTAVFSAPAFARSDFQVRQVLISPSIDPLSDKNRDLPPEIIDEVMNRFKLDREKPIITQISRFDYLKDPLGVIKAFKLVKSHIDCQLVLAGGGATDDPEGVKVLEEVQLEASDDPDIHVILLPPSSDLEINAIQRASTVILQKSIREGFGLTVAEGLWKGKPVIASGVGGIPLQIKHQYSGLLAYSVEGTAYYIKQIINDPEYANKLGTNGKEHIKNNFLITRHIRDYLLLFISLFNGGEVIQF